MIKNMIILAILLSVLHSCADMSKKLEINEVRVKGNVIIVGDGVDFEKYEMPIENLYVSKYEITWDIVTGILNYGLEKKKVIVKDSKVVSHAGYFPEYGNYVVDLNVCTDSIHYTGTQFLCLENSARKPATNIGWYGVAIICNLLSEMNGFVPCYDVNDWTIIKKSNGYRLPTFEEWEYIARGGEHNDAYEYSGSDNFEEVGWYSVNSENMIHEVGELKPNALDIYDMSGNVHEFCTETYKSLIAGSKANGSALITSNRIWRGGSFASDMENVYFYRQNINNPDYYFPFEDVGFRVVRKD